MAGLLLWAACYEWSQLPFVRCYAHGQIGRGYGIVGLLGQLSLRLPVFTQNSYTCCGLEWSRDENGNKTYYGYDGANRLAKMWTDITGQSSTTPLVSYTYDAFGNQQTVTTRSGASTSRVTSYDYDSANRRVSGRDRGRRGVQLR